MPNLRGRSLIFVVSEDWYFLSHRLPMARAARDLGFRVVVATRVEREAAAIRAEGFEVVPIPMDRASTAPLRELRCVAALVRLFRRERPALVHCVAIRPIVDAGLAALLFPKLPVINSFTGMGSVLGDEAAQSPLRRTILALLRRFARRKRSYAIVQNEDDRRFLLERDLVTDARTRLIPGSGIDLTVFPSRPEPAGAPVALMVSRLLHDKGVGELVAAARLLRSRGSDLRIRIAGDRDPANPNSVSEAELAAWQSEDLVEFLGRRDDVAALWGAAHIAVLPSYREGLPKSLLEAAASARPLVTTDVPGCRDLVPDGTTGILVPVHDSTALADALERLAASPDARRTKGQAARAMVEQRFSAACVAAKISALYQEVAL